MTPAKVTALLFLCLACNSSRADNWPRFRGPNGTGVAHDKDIPVKFDASSGILWKVPMPGPANASPIVWDKYVFVHSATPDGDKRVLTCLNVKDGQTVWTRAIPAAKAPINPRNTLASSTPATDGQIVVNAFWDGKEILLTAYDFTGKQLWQKNLGTWVSQHGAGCSPILYQDKVIFVKDMDSKDKDENEVPNPSILYAFNKKTGELIWSAPREAYRACYSAPFLLEKPGASPELLVTSTTSIRSYQPAGGKVNWEWNWIFTAEMPLRTTGSSLYHNGMLFACSGDGRGDRHMAAVKLTGNGAGTRAVTAWENKKDFPYVPTLLARGEHLYFVNDRGFAGCFHAASGKNVWLKRQPEATFAASPVLIDGKMYAVSEAGDVYVFAAEPTYQLLAKNSLGERARATPAVANKRLFILGHNHLFCIGK